MTELRYDAWTARTGVPVVDPDGFGGPGGPGGLGGPGSQVGLRVVPDLVRAPLGEGVLPEEAPLDQELVLRRRLRVTHDVVTLVLEPTVPGGVSFRPGQYVTLAAEVDGVAVERCYTISSPPTRPHLLTVTVKRVEGGGLSPWLHDGIEVGDRVTARGPLGGFTVAEHPAPRYLLLSAGSGVTPTLSTLRAMADLGDLGGAGDTSGTGLDVVVVHAGRTPADLPCRAELEALATTEAGLRVVWVCEDDAEGWLPWTGPRGRLSAALLAEQVPDLLDREVLTCGPPGFMAAVRAALASLGVDPARCHEESFELGEAAAPGVPPVDGPGAPVADVAPASVRGVTVRFGRSGREVACPPGTTVLTAAQQAGVVLPSSCGGGLCGTCKSGLLAGKVEMNHQGGIRPREVAAGKFLPCCSTPDGDIVVDA